MKINLLIIPALMISGAANAVELNKTVNEYDNMTTYRRVPADPAKSPKSGWYAGIQGIANFASWTYSCDGCDGMDGVSFAPEFGGSIFIGGKIERNWRGEIEIGYIGLHSDDATFKDERLTFRKSATTVAFNAIWDGPQKKWGGFYAGAGIGVAYVAGEFRSDVLAASDASSAGPLGQILAGYEKSLSESLTLNFGIKGGAYYVPQTTYKNVNAWSDGNCGGAPGPGYCNINIAMDLGAVWNLSANLGIRYDF